MTLPPSGSSSSSRAQAPARTSSKDGTHPSRRRVVEETSLRSRAEWDKLVFEWQSVLFEGLAREEHLREAVGDGFLLLLGVVVVAGCWLL